MTCGGRHFCPGCNEELIHRDNRKPWESASAFGQIVWREGPVRLTTGDIDHYAWRSLPDRELLRLIEHKQPQAHLGAMQEKVLRLLGLMFSHAIACADSPVSLHPESGVYVMRGAIQADATGRRLTRFVGPQAVERIGGGTSSILANSEAVFRFLEGAREGEPSGPRRSKQMPLPFIQEAA